MNEEKVLSYLKDVIQNRPSDWLKLTTHRLDIYNEELAKTQFLEQFESLFEANNSDTNALSELPTAYDYIRLGHPLSCVLEWSIGKMHGVNANSVICFASQMAPIMAILRTNLFEKKSTRILYSEELPSCFDADSLGTVYGYSFELTKFSIDSDISAFDGTTILLEQRNTPGQSELNAHVDFQINLLGRLGSILIANGGENENYLGAIQHVRRRETIAMTPPDTLSALNALVEQKPLDLNDVSSNSDKQSVLSSIATITGSSSKALVASSGLSIQYAIMMGLVNHAMDEHPGKAIKFIVPPNCYGGTNDQARRVAACLEHVEVVDLPVDGGNDMVQSVDKVLTEIAREDAIPYIIAEIPTNPRVEVPELNKLRDALSKVRETADGNKAVDPVFILDQTFCPNVHFLGTGEILSTVRTIAYVSGSKFPSGGRCTAGYCVGNSKTDALLEQIEKHLLLCDNEATGLQYHILAEQMPSMVQRIKNAYTNTRSFVNYISEALPEAKINFVSEELAEQGFTPSVFSLDLPTKGNTEDEKEAYKRELNHRLIDLMISRIPNESKYCVSYGQLQGCYWTIPATSTQGTTKEGDKDYIARVALSPDMDLDLHKKVFQDFVDSI